MSHDQILREVACDSIRVSDRHRKDMGDLEGLAVSIATEGLLQPIGITEGQVLVFGERRLLAIRDILQRATIPARVVHVSSIVAGEYAENEIRKDFTPSERVAIGKTLEAEIGGRQGTRTDLELRRNCGEVPGRTVDVVAQKAGFGSAETYERAKSVVDRGAPDLVQAMDTGDVSIHAASVIATQPAERQTEIVQTPRELRRQIVREIRKTLDLPTTAEARRLARETGNLVADRTGRYRSCASEEERASTKADLDAIWTVTRAVLALADTRLDPLELAARLEYWHCPEIRAKTPAALQWLTRFWEGVEHNAAIS